MIHELPEGTRLDLSMYDYNMFSNDSDRRLYLMSEIETFDPTTMEGSMSVCSQIVDDILSFNRQDLGVETQYRKPIRLYINSIGGDVTEGFAVVSAIEQSKTPVYTINVGRWCSMAFLIGIAGHKRFSLPNMVFLMHDGTNITWDSGCKAQDKMEFDKKFKEEIVRKHVLKHSKMSKEDYAAKVRMELYMLPEEALERGFIDEIVTNIDDIL